LRCEPATKAAELPPFGTAGSVTAGGGNTSGKPQSKEKGGKGQGGIRGIQPCSRQKHFSSAELRVGLPNSKNLHKHILTLGLMFGKLE